MLLPKSVQLVLSFPYKLRVTYRHACPHVVVLRSSRAGVLGSARET
jgi:hypothetical protein